jgi:hypothetical protein
MEAEITQKLDENGLKTGQALTIILLIVAFVLDSWVIVALRQVDHLAGPAGHAGEKRRGAIDSGAAQQGNADQAEQQGAERAG